MPRTLFWGLSIWSLGIPLAACGVLAAAAALGASGWALAPVGAALVAAVLMAVHHAEVVAHRVGEPFGTLILALAVTVIETALIVSMMLSGGPDTPALARDTVYAAVMIVCNGVLGLCLLLGALRYRVLTFQVDGAIPTLSVLVAMSVLTLVLPNFTLTTSGPTFSASQLVFAGVVSLVLYGAFVFVQTVRHREYFLAVADEGADHAQPPSTATAAASMGLLMVCLVAVVGLAKTLSPAIRAGVESLGAPASVVGVAIALLVLLPETWAAVRAAQRNRMQTSLNLALGSALATIGLTIPTVAAVSILLGLPLVLGLPAKETVLLGVTLVISGMSLSSGRATVLQGAVHLALFAVFLFLAVVP